MFSDRNYSASQAKTVPIAEDEESPPNNEQNSAPDIDGEIASGGIPLNDIPPYIRRCLASMGTLHHVTNEHRVSKLWLAGWFLFTFIHTTASACGIVFILHHMLDHWAVAIVVGVAGQLGNVVGLLATRHMTGAPVFHELLRAPETRKSIERKVRESVQGLYVALPVLTVLVIIVGVLPALKADVFGDMTRPVIWTALGLLVPNVLLSPWMFGPQNVIPLALAHATSQKIKNYLKTVKDTMLRDVDLEKGDGEASLFRRLAKEQVRIERWARSLNKSFSTWNGILAFMILVWIFVWLGLAAIAGSASSGGIAVLLSFAMVFFVMFGIQLNSYTMASRIWIFEKNRLLNNARLVPVIKREFCPHFTFGNWLDHHEASATRFGWPGGE